jgi:hypothetical protein
VEQLQRRHGVADAGRRRDRRRAVAERSLDLFEATRAAPDAPWGVPEPLAALSTASYEADAHLSPDGLVVIFASDRPGGAGLRDLWLSRRERPGAALSEPVVLSELATAQQDEDPWLSGDGRTLFFSSDRSGNQELWIATR